ncbi:hypothetical protein SASPL_131469 [Salvia splendens]|uniref:Uncharacterized protein n=1 Tax=Salvia splendens TaxID=180675 RepID=A0A8X8X7I2_SALSN|nr:hypothetical protein SASPL_131469 [Salvia splendens]
MATAASAPKWAQKTITIPAQSRGCHLITSKKRLHYVAVCASLLSQILKEIGQDLSGFKCGLAHFFRKFCLSGLL